MECSHSSHSERTAHLAAIDAIVARWQAGELTLTRKRELIAEENTFYHGRSARGRSGKLITVAAEDATTWWQDA